MLMDEAHKYCGRCKAVTWHYRKGTNHILHLLITLFMCGIWLPVWILLAIKIGGWKCKECGYGGNPMLSLVAPLLLGLLLVGPCVFAVFRGASKTPKPPASQPASTIAVPSSAQETPKTDSPPATDAETTASAPKDGQKADSPPATDAETTASAPKTKRYRLIRAEGFAKSVWIDPNYKYDPQVYEQAIDDLAGNNSHATLFFWDNLDLIPKRMPMNDREIEAQVAQYDRNRSTGNEAFYYFRNGVMVEPFGGRPSTTPKPTPAKSPTEGTATPKREPEAKPKAKTLRTWKDSSGGFSVRAELAGYDSATGEVTLRKEDGSEISIAVDRLSETDQFFAKRGVTK